MLREAFHQARAKSVGFDGDQAAVLEVMPTQALDLLREILCTVERRGQWPGALLCWRVAYLAKEPAGAV
eukprot:4030910-Alexandrium_andersonii.AAC.1